MTDILISGTTHHINPTPALVREAVQAVLEQREHSLILDNVPLGVCLQLSHHNALELLLITNPAPHPDEPPAWYRSGIPARPESLSAASVQRVFAAVLNNDPHWQDAVVWGTYGGDGSARRALVGWGLGVALALLLVVVIMAWVLR